jgi:membrane protease YdiL (CAAX protease family)
MSTHALDRDPVSSPHLIAPLWHTVLLVCVFTTIAVAGALFQHRSAAAGELPHTGSAAGLYLSLIIMEWGLVLYVWKAGLRRSGTPLRSLVGGRWTRPRDVAVDVMLALGTWGLWTLFGLAWDHWAAPDHAASVSTMLPRTPVEIGLWLMLSLSAGIAEELVFRGYLQVQLHALTGRRGVALFLQAILFGVSHGYQGLQACLRIVIYGLLLGVLARVRGSLRPGMVAHAWTDIAAGIFRI